MLISLAIQEVAQSIRERYEDKWSSKRRTRDTFPNDNWAVLGLASKTCNGYWRTEVPQRGPGAEPLVDIKDQTVSSFTLLQI